MNQFLFEFTEEESKDFYHKLNLGQRVKLIRKKLSSLNEDNYSLTSIAEEVNVHVSTLSRFENQNTNLKLQAFLKLAEHLNFSLDLILKGRLIYRNQRFNEKIVQKLKNYSSYNERIKYLQQELNVNTDQLNNSSLTPSTFNKIINKKVDPKIRTIVIIADLFQINIDLLIKGYYPTNQLAILNRYKENLSNLTTEFPAKINILKGMIKKQNYEEDLKEIFLKIISYLLEIVKLLPQQLQLRKLFIHSFKSKLNKINNIYKPLNSIINHLDNIIKNSTIPLDRTTLLSQIENELRETKLTLDGLSFHQKNKATGSEKSLTIFNSIAQPLNKTEEKLHDLKINLNRNKKSNSKEKSTRNNLEKKLKTKNINTAKNNLKLQPNIQSNQAQVNSNKTNLKELYQKLNSELKKIKSQLEKYWSNLNEINIVKKLEEYWQIYDLLQLELEIFWNRELILNEISNKLKLQFKILILSLINLINPLNRLLKVLNGESPYHNYYVNSLLNLLKQEMSTLSKTPNPLNIELLTEIQNKTEEFIALI
jgi:transcriptional regulator with XRE-family HTH domain